MKNISNKTTHPRVLILGYGEMGHAMEYLLQSQQLDIWDRSSKPTALETLVPHADFIIFCLPVNPHNEIAQQLVPYLKASSICLSIAKGLDEQGKTAAQIFAEVFNSKQSYALLYGPMISEEICKDRYAFAQVGCRHINTYNKIKELFADTKLYLEYCDDIIGISWCVILKNAYAILLGISDELKMGDNVRGYLMYATLQELDQIVRLMGGKKDISYNLAGLGDLITTATSEDSHHHELGCMLARGETSGIEGEGVHTLKMVTKHQLFTTTSFPLFQLITDIIKQPTDVAEKINRYLQQQTV